MRNLETATVAELAADYRAAIERGEMTGLDMEAIVFDVALARRLNERCGEYRSPGGWGYTSSKLAAALREATRGES